MAFVKQGCEARPDRVVWKKQVICQHAKGWPRWASAESRCCLLCRMAGYRRHRVSGSTCVVRAEAITPHQRRSKPPVPVSLSQKFLGSFPEVSSEFLGSFQEVCRDFLGRFLCVRHICVRVITQTYHTHMHVHVYMVFTHIVAIVYAHMFCI